MEVKEINLFVSGRQDSVKNFSLFWWNSSLKFSQGTHVKCEQCWSRVFAKEFRHRNKSANLFCEWSQCSLLFTLEGDSFLIHSTCAVLSGNDAVLQIELNFSLSCFVDAFCEILLDREFSAWSVLHNDNIALFDRLLQKKKQTLRMFYIGVIGQRKAHVLKYFSSWRIGAIEMICDVGLFRVSQFELWHNRVFSF